MYELFEHTADLGLRRSRRGPEHAVRGSRRVPVLGRRLEDIGSVRPEQSVTVELAGTDREFLLFDWLRDLLLRFDADHMVFGKFEVKVRDDGLTGTAWGEPLDPERHLLAHEVKAITYHELKVVRDGDEWLAEVIVDI